MQLYEKAGLHVPLFCFASFGIYLPLYLACAIFAVLF